MPDLISRLTDALADRYAIERELGEGGMATVYLARDLRHNRSVAIKVLKPELAAVVGAERFLAEIETTANLQHPHILPLFDSGEADGFLFYVMPYVEGETLRDRIDREQQLPVDEAVGMAIAIANALQTAHEQGIVHRDIKPANILLSRGEPLVADFGIALAVHAGGGGRMTETGLSLGTPYYMSPEQATGDQAVGPPADIYALGSVLYEMLIGDPPYPGSSAQAVLGKILQGAPPSATATRRSIPLNVDGAILKALEKLPADRFASAKDFVGALTNPAFRYGTGAELAAAGGRRWAPVAGLLGLLVLGLSGALVWALGRAGDGPGVTRFALALEEAVAPGQGLPDQGRLSLSPDGRRLVFVGPGPEFGTQLWMKDMAQLDPRPIPGTEGAVNVTFSPDGLDVAFVRAGGVSRRQLRRVSLDGGPSVLLTDSLIDLGGVSWGYDGYIYADTKLEGDGFGRVPESGGPPEPVTMPAPGEGWHSQPFALPNGRGVIYYVSGGDRIGVVDLDSGETRILVDGVWAGYANSGHLLWLSEDGMLLAQRFDPDSFELSGRAVPLTESVAAALDFGGGNVALSASGDLVYVEGDVSNEEMVLVWVDRAGTETVLDSTWVRPFRGLDVSPDGSQIVAAVQEGEESHLWVRPTGDGPQRKLTFDGWNRDPIWLPDGEWIGYVREDGIFRRRADGSGGEIRVADGELPLRPHWTRDGAWVVYDDVNAVWGQPLDEGGLAVGERVKLVDDPNVFDGLARVSPDGRWISFIDVSEGEPRVYVRPFPNTDDGLWLITEGFSMGAAWSADSRQLVFRAGDLDQLQVVDILPGENFAHSAPRALFSLAGYRWPNLARGSTALTPDAEQFLLLKHPGAEVPERLIYVQNIFRVLDEQVGN